MREDVIPKSFLYRPFFHLIVIGIVGLFVYSGTFNVPFQWDDIWHLTQDSIIQNPDNFFAHTKGYEYNPRRYIGYLTFALNYHWGGLHVVGYHVVNLAIHILNGVLVYFFVILTFRTPYFSGNPSRPPLKLRGGEGGVISLQPIALFSALLFVAHPLQTQAVTYIVQRFASLAAMFYLLSIVFYIKGRLSDTKAGKLASFVLSFLCAALAMKTKEIAFTLPLMIILFEFVFFKSSLKQKALVLFPVVLTLFIIPVSIMGAHEPLGELLSDMSEKTRVQTEIPRWDYLMTEMRVITTYIRLIILPVNQNIDYDYPIYHSLLTLPVFLSFLFLSALLAVALYLLYRSRRSESLENMIRDEGAMPGAPIPVPNPYSRLIGFGILWFFIALSVESSLIPIADVIFEHRVYLPSVGAFLSLTAGIFMMASKFRDRKVQKGAILFLALLIAGYSIAAYARNSLWKSRISLWEDTVKKSPLKARTHINLGSFAYDPEGLFDKAIEQYRIAIGLSPNEPEAHSNLGIRYSKKGWMDKAIEEYRIVLQLKPDHVNTHNNLGNVFQSQGLTDKAVEQYETAIRIKPDFAEAHHNLGVAFMAKGWDDKAIEQFLIATRLRPGFPDAHYSLGVAYAAKGWNDRAIEQLLIVVRLNPNDAEAHFNLANTYMQVHLTDKAVEQYQAALALNPDYGEAHFNLGVAYLEKGLREDARREFESALRLNPGDNEAMRVLHAISK